MDETFKKGLYYLGIIAALYILFYFILPALFSVLGFAFKLIFHVFFWAAIAFVIVIFVAHMVKIFKRRSD